MKNELLLYSLIYVFAVFISAVSQIMLKISAKKSYKSKIREYMNPLVIISYGLFFGCTLITMLAYRKVPLSMGQILESSGYIFVTVLGTTILKEKLSRKKMIGMAVILVGIFVFTL
jgi:drug/metabolite transporter (DMT)-like permease